MAKHTDRSKRPDAANPDYSMVPVEIRSLRQWVMWRFDWSVKEGNWAKVPYRIDGKRGSSTNPLDWSTFESCITTFEQSKSKYDGIGFVFSKDNDFIGIDLDDCVQKDPDTETFSLTPFAQLATEKLNTYTELSPSLTGLHFIGRSSVLEAVKTTHSGNKIEMYGQGRYFTFTGISWQLEPLPIQNIESYAQEILSFYKTRQPTPSLPLNIPKHNLSIEERIDLAIKRDSVKKLFNGDISEYNGDDSVADMALCSYLAYYCEGRSEILDAMFRKSQLLRPKWDERRGDGTYGSLTINKILSSQREYLSLKKTNNTSSSYDSRKMRRFTFNDLWDKALIYRSSGEAMGVTTGWYEMDKHYRPALRDLTVVTGIPGSGKSTWLDVLTYNIAMKNKWQFTYASFETLPLERHVLNLCQIHLGKPTFKFLKDVQVATDEEMELARKEISEFFHFVLPDENEMDMFSILKYVDDDIKDYEIKGFVLDPFTEIDQTREKNVSQKEYIRSILRALQDFTRRREIASWLVAHPTKPNGETFRNGRPTLYSIDGSSDFFNKPEWGLIVHRSESDKTTVYIDKVRNDIAGKRGEVDFEFDKHKKSYSILGGEMPVYEYEEDGFRNY